MRNSFKTIAIVTGITAIFAGVSFYMFHASAFTGPGANPSTGNGQIATDAAKDVAVGTSTTDTHTKLLVIGADSADTNKYAFTVTDGLTSDILSARNDDTVALGGSTLDSGLVAWWKFDDGTGSTARDSSGNGAPLILYNNPSWITNGEIGGALTLDGASQYGCAIGNQLLGSGPTTISVWLYMTSEGHTFNTILASHTNLVKLYAIPNGGLNNYLLLTLNADGTDLSLGNFVANQWDNIVLTYTSGGTANFYVNGVSMGSGYAGTPSTDSAPLCVGSDATYGRDYFPGSIDDMRIYDRVISATEIQELYAYFQPGNALTVNGTISSVGGLSGSVAASNVTTGEFASGNFSFPSSLGVNTSTNVSLPGTISDYGTLSVSSTSTLAGSATFSVLGASTNPCLKAGTTGTLSTSTCPIQASNNLSDIGTPATARTNLGVAGGVLIGEQVLTSGTTYTPDTGTKTAIVELWGGGGGGGGCSNVAGCASGGGGSGGYAKYYLTSVSGTYTYALGAAGSAGSSGAGGNGGNTTFTHSGTTVTAFGGTGGAFTAGTAAIKFTAGGAGGVISTNGTINGAGEPGGWGMTSSTVTIGATGYGGSTSLGGGGVGVIYTSATNVAGNAAVANTGSGGSGGGTGKTTAAAGGAGAKGVIIIWEYE